MMTLGEFEASLHFNDFEMQWFKDAEWLTESEETVETFCVGPVW
jgi:hypothetical protein